jgi:hypothetical protein
MGILYSLVLLTLTKFHLVQRWRKGGAWRRLSISQQDFPHITHDPTKQTTSHACKIQTNPNTVPLFSHYNLWWYIKDHSKLTHYIIGNFCSQAFRGTKWGWQCIGFWVYILRICLQLWLYQNSWPVQLHFSRKFYNTDCKVLVIDGNYARTTMLSLVIKTDAVLTRIFETGSGYVIWFNPSTQ